MSRGSGSRWTGRGRAASWPVNSRRGQLARVRRVGGNAAAHVDPVPEVLRQGYALEGATRAVAAPRWVLQPSHSS